MKGHFDRLIPHPCEDELASANQFLDKTAHIFYVEPIDIRTIARSESIERANEYIKLYKKVFAGLRHFDNNLIIEHCVEAYNNTSILIEFSKSVTEAMKFWEERIEVPEMSIWCDHPSNFDSLRTYVWAQQSFRETVRKHASRKIKFQSEIGSYRNSAPEKGIELLTSPVERLIDYLDIKYKMQLGTMPIPE